MNKSNLVAAVQATMEGATKTEAERAVEAVIGAIKQGIKDDANVQLIGFGTFTVVDKPERMGKNPQTGQPMTISASRQVKFKPGKGLKEML